MRPPLLFVAFSALLLGACYSAGDGEPPVLDQLYFPTGVALDIVDASVKPAHLFVASSDFDLQFRASALASYDLGVLESSYLPHNCNTDADCSAYGSGQVCDNLAANSGTAQNTAPSYFCVPADNPKPCGDLGEHSAADQVLYPGRCASIDPRVHTDVIDGAVEIGAFATDVLFKPTGSGGDSADFTGRLFLPVRGDATLHWIDVHTPSADPNSPVRLLNCGQENTTDDSCDDAHRIGDDEYGESPNLLRQEPEPFAIAIDDAGENIAVTNQTTGSVSLYVNQWANAAKPISLVYLLTGLPIAPVGIAALPTPLQLDQAYQSGFLAVYADAPQVDLLRVQADVSEQSSSTPTDYSYNVRVLTRAASVAITANSNGSNSRGIVIDDAQRNVDYDACLQTAPACVKDPLGRYPNGAALTACACPQPPGDALNACKAALQICLQSVHQPGVFVANRAPASLVLGTLGASSAYASGTSELPAFTDSVPLSVGPSRVVLGKVKVPAPAGKLSDAAGPYALEARVFIVCFDSRKIYIYDPVRHVIDSIVSTGRGPYALVVDELRGLGYVAHFTDSYLGVISLDQRFPQNYASIVASIGVPSAPRASK